MTAPIQYSTALRPPRGPEVPGAGGTPTPAQRLSIPEASVDRTDSQRSASDPGGSGWARQEAAVAAGAPLWTERAEGWRRLSQGGSGPAGTNHGVVAIDAPTVRLADLAPPGGTGDWAHAAARLEERFRFEERNGAEQVGVATRLGLPGGEATGRPAPRMERRPFRVGA